MKTLKLIGGLFILVLALASCKSKEQSSTTGWHYNDSNWGGFEVSAGVEQQAGPGLVFIEGGSFVMGKTTDDIAYEWDNAGRRVSVSSFYMDEAEVSNVAYREYLYWLNRAYGAEYPEVVAKATPDENVWRSRLSYNDMLVEHYFHEAAYNEYPVVGVTWVQANNYCKWRTDRVNEKILVDHGILNLDVMDLRGDNAFQTDVYAAGLYMGEVNKELENLDPSVGGTRLVKQEDGILLPKYRLPSEAEWEYAAYGLIGNTVGERIVEGRIYPWNGNTVRSADKKTYGEMMANFKRGRGDNMGVAGGLNDAADYTAPVRAYFPNDYGLYNMAGNVSEWCMDVYRKLTFEDVEDMNPFRGNVFKQAVIEDEEVLRDSLGNVVYKNIDDDFTRRNYKQADNINYLDGDFESTLRDDGGWNKSAVAGDNPDLAAKLNVPDSVTGLVYKYGTSSLVSNTTRVVKGGSWKDRAYWLSPSNRRYLDQNLSTDWIGFRCAMSRVGSSLPNKK